MMLGPNVSNTNMEGAMSDEGESQLRFDPPVYRQRYFLALDFINHHFGGAPIKVVDFGCSEMTFVSLVKRTEGVTSIMAVDCDRNVLESWLVRAQPHFIDSVNLRKLPLNVSVYQGSVCDPDYRLIGTDALIAIELIEHLDPGVLDRFPHNVFGYIRPNVAIITTPNADFNVLFKQMKYGNFRHPDHRFEWTREQFQDWCTNIITRYPAYTVEFQDVGMGPDGTEHLGGCSQAAIFINKDYVKLPEIQSNDIQKDIISNSLNAWDSINSPDTNVHSSYYDLVASYDFPYFIDKRTIDEKVLDDVSHTLMHRFNRNYDSMYYNEETDDWRIPIHKTLPFSRDYEVDDDHLKKILSDNKYIVEGDVLIYKGYDCPADSDDDLNISGSDTNVYVDVDDDEQAAESINESW